MTMLTRRQTLVAGAAFGLAAPLQFTPSRALAELRETGFYRYTVGDAEVISLYDGVWNKGHAENFITGVSVEETKSALRKGGLRDDQVTIDLAQTVIRNGGRTVLIDAGTGGQVFPTAGGTMDNLGAAGLKSADLDAIVISHFHPDHIFGLTEDDNVTQRFPDTEIIVGRTEYEFWTDPGTMATLPEFRRGVAQLASTTFPNWSNLTVIEDDAEVAPGLRAVLTPGHTPGHLAFHLASDDAELMVLGDLVLLPPLFVRNPGWQPVFDLEPNVAEATRRAIMDRVVSDEMTVAGYHFGFPNSGTLSRDENGFMFVAGHA